MRTIYLLMTFILFVFFSCENPEPEMRMATKEKDEEKPQYLKLLKDPNYHNGFKLGSTDESNPNQHGVLDYGGTVKNPVWLIAQWNNLNNDLLSANYRQEGTKNTYETNGGFKVVSNTANGELELQVITSSEYGLNDITSNPRKTNEPWPTLLIEQNLSENEILKISDKEEIRMAIKYNVFSLIDKIPTEIHPDLHTAQFQWFITVQNRNMSSPDYGRYIWFGLNFYDKRYDFPPLYAAQDGGKEQNTGAFIYMPDMRDIMGSQGRTEIGKYMDINVDILPIISEAFRLAHERNYLTNTTWNDLYIGATNIGWEVPGTYDVSVLIQSVNILYR